MSGEATIATKLVVDAIDNAEQESSMSADTMAHAILSAVLVELSKTRSRRDLESFIDFDLDNIVEVDNVITRGC
jgi:hypothetical protein